MAEEGKLDEDIGRTDAVRAARWGEARRRIAILRRYMSLENPSVADADDAAAEIGVKRRMLYMLVRVMRVQSEMRAAGPRPAKTRIAPEVDDLIREMVAAADPAASLNSIAEGIREEARRRGLPPPQNKTVRTRLEQARAAHRAAADRSSGTPEFAIDHSALLISATNGDRTGAVHATVVLDLGARRVVGLHLGLDQPGPESAAAALLDAIHGMAPSIDAGPAGDWLAIVHMTHDGHPPWITLRDLLERAHLKPVARVASRAMPGVWLSRIVGRTLLGVPLRPRLDKAELDRRVAGMTPIAIDELRAVMGRKLAERIPAHPAPISQWSISALTFSEGLVALRGLRDPA